MNFEITTLDLSFRRKSLVGYSVGMALYVLVVVALYPSFKDATNLDDLMGDSSGLAALFGISGSLTTPTGWLDANIYANFFPLLTLLLTIGYGAWALAGQEADGHLEMVLSLPFGRAQVIGEKIVALVVQAVLFSVVVFASSLAGRAFDLDVPIGNLAAATLAVALLGIDFGLLALAIGAGTGNRGLALAVASAVAAGSYLLSTMAPLVSWLDPVKYLSLFYWSVGDQQLELGVTPASLLVLVLVGLACGTAAIEAFKRHDLH